MSPTSENVNPFNNTNEVHRASVEGVTTYLQQLIAEAKPGEIDALLGEKQRVDDPDYQASYEQMDAAILLAAPEVQQMISTMRPLLKLLIENG